MSDPHNTIHVPAWPLFLLLAWITTCELQAMRSDAMRHAQQAREDARMVRQACQQTNR